MEKTDHSLDCTCLIEGLPVVKGSRVLLFKRARLLYGQQQKPIFPAELTGPGNKKENESYTHLGQNHTLQACCLPDLSNLMVYNLCL